MEPLAALTLLDLDLLQVVLLHHAKATRGWCHELASVAEVCTVWRGVLSTLHTAYVEAWHEYTWKIPKFSQLRKEMGPDEGLPFAPSASSGPYDWQIWVVPRARRAAPDNLPACPVVEFDEGLQLWVVEVIGVYLKVPTASGPMEIDKDSSAAGGGLLPGGSQLPIEDDELAPLSATQAGSSWARRTECELTLRHPTKPTHSRRRYFRHRFSACELDWGFPDGVAANALATTAELLTCPSGGFLDDDTLVICAQIRVSSGRLSCTVKDKGCRKHPLVRSDGLASHVEAVSDPLNAPLRFHCDLCRKTMPTSELHRCSRGCNFDVCNDCIDPDLHVLV